MGKVILSMNEGMSGMRYRLRITTYDIKMRIRPIYWWVEGELKDLLYRRKARKFLANLLERFPDKPDSFFINALVGIYGIKPSTAMKYIQQMRRE